MAYTKIHAIKATVDKAIDYICNPDKTDEKIFISSFACSPETAAIDFKYTLDHCRENSPNKAYHLIHSKVTLCRIWFSENRQKLLLSGK